jgi:hypothetical protein
VGDAIPSLAAIQKNMRTNTQKQGEENFYEHKMKENSPHFCVSLTALTK